MKNILMLDLSICFPSLILYDRQILTGEISYVDMFDREELHLVGVDYRTYSQLMTVVLKYCDIFDKSNIHFLWDGRNLKISEKFNLINVSNYSYYESFNHFRNTLDIDKYIWIKNGTSRDINHTFYKEERVFDFKWDLTDITDIYLVFSHDLIPCAYRQLFDALGNIYYYKFKQEPIFEDDSTRDLLLNKEILQ